MIRLSIAPFPSLRRHPLILASATSLMVAALTTAALADSSKPLAAQEQLCPAAPQSQAAALPATEPSSPPEGTHQDKVSPQALIAWLLGENLVRDIALDANRDGNTLIDEKISALTEDDYCSSISIACTADDQEALAKARAQLQAFADAGGGPGYIIERLDQAGNALPGPLDKVDPRELLDDRDPSVQIRCVALPGVAQEEDTAYWHENGDSGFRLTGDIDNLGKNRGSLGAVRPAELSITSDLIADETAYRVNVVTGYAFSLAGGNDVETLLIPFLEAERVTSGEETQIDTLGAGFQQAVTINWPGTLRSEFAITPLYRTDSDFESHTGTLKFRWTPSFAEPSGFPLGIPEVYGPIELRLGLNFLADVGRVFDEGDQGNLNGEGNFLRLGNQLGFQMRGAPGNLLRQVELQLANRYLYNVDTEFEHINQFDAALAYLFPGNENYQLSVAYSNGRDENSLELYEFWQTQFGIRF